MSTIVKYHTSYVPKPRPVPGPAASAASAASAAETPSAPTEGDADPPGVAVVEGGTRAVAEGFPVVDGGFARALMSCLGDLVFQVSRDGKVLSAQCPSDYEFMLSPEGMVGRRLMELLPTQLGLQAMHYLEKALRTSGPVEFTCQYNFPGRAREYQVRAVRCSAKEVVAVVRDVTDRKYFEKEILDVSHRTQLRIGQDLHDGLGQHLTGITFLSKALENKLVARGLPEAGEAAEIARLVIQALSQTRHLARSLFPSELETGGLAAALKELGASLRTLFKLACTVECDTDLGDQDPVVANHLFRLAQEAVNNAAKHGHAHHVTIRLFRQEDQLVLSVADDGEGFDPSDRNRTGLGLRIMYYRAKKIGGHLEIRTASAGGMEISCRVPMSPVLASFPGS